MSFAQNPVIRIDVNLVQVDAVVTDSANKHISNLKAEDFEVLQDGKPQTITNCSYIASGIAPLVITPSPSNGRNPLPPPQRPLPTAGSVRRMFALVVDDLEGSPSKVSFTFAMRCESSSIARCSRAIWWR
ncbi:MAG: hypothetical protein ABSG03_37345, partial [Bryobacteraceae bacterium]